MKKVIVCGGRRYANRSFVKKILDISHSSITISCVVHGGAGAFDPDTGEVLYGADLLAGEWAMENGIKIKDYTVTSADWKRYGKRAGILRNMQMFDHENPDYVIAFPGGTGTRQMVEYALNHGKEVLDANSLKIIKPYEPPSLEDFY